MTTTPPEAPSGPPPQDPTRDSGPRVTRDEVRDLGRLRRSTTDRKVAGVAGGLGRHLDVDPLILRVAFVVLVFFGGAGIIVYGACWLLVPEDGDSKAPFNLDERTRTVALLIVGGVATLALIGDSWGAFWFPWPVAIVALVALWLLTRNNTPKNAPAPPPVPPYGAPAYDAPAAYDSAASYFEAPYVPPTQENPYAAVPQPAYYPPQPPYVAPPVTQRVPNPRKRGPILFWFTLALIALCEGLLGMADLAGADVADSAYPALAVAICGVMLLIGAFFGRAGGIILAGLIATVALTGATAADRWDGDQVNVQPTTSAALDDRYWLDAGEQIIDLRDVSDLSNLDGQVLEVEGGVGRIEVILPVGLAASVNADVDGPGDVVLFNEEHGGIDVSASHYDGTDQEPELIINTHLGVGQIEVHR
jgi:phage shock protein PspC (stress-responsive transcriptional regulator)